MRWLRRATGALRALRQTAREGQELDEEIRTFVDSAVDAKMRTGMSLGDARRAVRLEMGSVDVVKEAVRDVGWESTLENLWRDARDGIRLLRRSPGFAAVAVMTLGLGIGANTAIFSIVDGLLLRPLPVRDPESLTFLRFPRDASHFDPRFSVAEFREIEAHTRGLFSGVNAMILGGLWGPTARADGLTVDGVTRSAQTLFVSGGFFEMLGIQPHLGRLILSIEGSAPGGDAVAVLSYRYWQSRFGGNPDVVGKPALINGRPVTIVGVAPQGFFGPTPLLEMEAYLPLGMLVVETGGDTAFLTGPTTRQLVVLARLAPGVSLAGVNQAIGPFGEQLVKAYPRPDAAGVLQVRPLRPPGLVNGPNPLPGLAALFLILAGLVLALACLNLANLSLVRAAARQREMAVRAALGGSRARLVRHVLAETVVLAVLGAAAGMLVGTIAVSTSGAAAANATDLPIVFEFPFNVRVFTFALGVALLSAAIVGIVPALRVSSGNVSAILHDRARGATGHRSQRARSALVAVQVGGSLALLIVAGLFVRSLQAAQHADLGFDPANVLNVKLDPGQIGYTNAQARQLYRRLAEEVRALPGIQSASLAVMVPLLNDVVPQDEITIPRYVTRPGERLHASYNAVSSGYFATMRIAVVAGREISESDSESAAPVALVNRAMAERFWPGASPLGRRFVRAGDKQHPLEIIGVVGNSRTEDLFSPYVPMFYIPVTQDDSPAQTLQVRTAGPPGAMAQEVLDIVRRLAPAAPVLSVRTMADAVNNGANGLFFFNLGAALTGVLGLLGLTLAVIGVYGVAASAVGHRTHEIGLRMALGARRVQIFWMLSRQGLTIVGLGMALGVLVAIAVGRLMGDFLMGVGPTDPLTYSIVSALLGVVALLACYVPVRRVLSGDPLVALRHE